MADADSSTAQHVKKGLTVALDTALTEARYRAGLANLNELEEARRLKLNADSSAGLLTAFLPNVERSK